MTLAQKVKKATEEADTAEEAAHNLKDILTKEEHSKVWPKHNVEMKKKSAKDQKEFAKLNKGEKGFLAALHMVKTTAPKFFHMKESAGQSQTLDKKLGNQKPKCWPNLAKQNLQGILKVEESNGGQIHGQKECGTTRIKET